VARIVVHSMGSRGDVFPYVPVANELCDRGHDVTFVVPREFHPLFARERFECRHSGTDFGPREFDRHAAYIARWGRVFSGAMLFRLYFGRLISPYLPQLHAAVDDALKDADLLLANSSTSSVARIAADERDVPWVGGDLLPFLVPSAEYAPPGIPVPQHLGELSRRMNRAVWSLGSSRLARMLPPSRFERDFASFRAEHGLTTPRDYVIAARFSPVLNVNLVSRYYFPPARDWPANYQTVGFTHWSGPRGSALPDDVEAFLAAGDPPVLVTLATIAASAAPQVFAAAATVLDRLHLRGIYLVSNEANVAALAGRAGVWPFVPLEPLLPRCRAAIHSGSGGTSAMVLGAGLPSVVIPGVGDQRWHGQRQRELGTGIFLRRGSQPALRSAIEAVVANPSYRSNAESISSAMANEDGPRSAADAIEALLRS
jgi:rhamnosyltransferase subunit B